MLNMSLSLFIAGAVVSGQVGGTESGRTNTDRVRRAEALFERGEMAFAQGRLEEARRLLEQAYALDSVPVLLYNLARVEEAAGDADAALARYREYLRRFPNAEYSPLVSRRVEVLQAQKDTRQKEAATPDRYTPPPAPPSTALALDAPPDDDGPSLAGPITLLSLGVAGAAAGVILGVLSQSRYDDAEVAQNQQTAFDRFGEAQDLGRGANIAYAAAGTAAAAGALWWILQASAD